MNDESIARAAQQLLVHGAMRRSHRDMKILRAEDIRVRVRERLNAVGLELDESQATDMYGVRVLQEYWDQDENEETNNKALGRDAFAALTVFWCKLVLPYRTQIDRQEVRGQTSFDAKQNRQRILDNPPVLQVDSVYEEFKEQLGTRSHFKHIVGRLKAHGFLAGKGQGRVTLGPNLDTAIDWHTMKDFVEHRLADVASQAQGIPQVDARLEDEVYGALAESVEPLGTAAIAELTNLEQSVVKTLIDNLRAEGRVQALGDKRGRTYIAVAESLEEE